MNVPSDCSALIDLFAEKDKAPELDTPQSSIGPSAVGVACMLLSTAALVFIISVHMPVQWSSCLRSGIVAIIVSMFVTINHLSLRHC